MLGKYKVCRMKNNTEMKWKTYFDKSDNAGVTCVLVSAYFLFSPPDIKPSPCL